MAIDVRARTLQWHARVGVRAVRAAVERRSSLPGAIVLSYHDVLSDSARPSAASYAVTQSRLRQQLGVLARMGLVIVSLPDLAQRLTGCEPVDGLAAITFDDALVGVHHYALPELAARGWPATLLPVVDRLGQDPPWWPGSQRTMTRAELAESVAGGITLAAHGARHVCLPCQSDQVLEYELATSRDSLVQLVRKDVADLVYPFGHYDARVIDRGRAAGYTAGYTFLNGRVTSAVDRWRIPRLTMTQQTTSWLLWHQLARAADDWPANSQTVWHPDHS